MKHLLIITAATLALASCSQTTKRDAALGGVTGATVGAIATGTPRGALIGAVVGTTAGVVIGKATERGKCRYRDRRGRIYIARCPR
jgi:hypothetical protein